MRTVWEVVHNLFVHPLMALSFNSRWSLWLHDHTAELAFGKPPEYSDLTDL